MTALPEPEWSALPLREQRRRRLEAAGLHDDIPTLPGRRCSECGSPVAGRTTAYTCSEDCSTLRRKRVNRDRAARWRDRAKQAMAGALSVYGPDATGPPPIAFLNVLSQVPAGATLTLRLPNGDHIVWARR